MSDKKRVLIGMSGGIDSTVAALLLLEQGYELVGATFRTFDPPLVTGTGSDKACCSEDSITEAAKMAHLLGFEHHILDFRDTFRKHVIDNFVSECENAVDTSVSLLAIPLAIAIGFGLAFLIVKIQASKLKTVVQKADAADYVGNVVLTYQNDQFMYRNVTSSPKVKSDSSSTHASASGRTHGGGNKSF